MRWRGGQNRTHGTLRTTYRLDSFNFSSELANCSRVQLSGEAVDVSSIPNPYGGARAFFICPGCGRRVRFLYFLQGGRHRCRICARLNYPSQQTTHDALEYYDRAVKILRDNLHVVDVPMPIELPGYVPSKPPWMRQATYSRYARQVRELGDKYRDAFLEEAMRILGWM